MQVATILVAEEDEATRAFLVDNLTADGYEVLTAETVGHAHSLLRREPDLMVVDVNGKTLALVEGLRAGEIPGVSNTVPIIVLTARSLDELHKLRAFERGCDDVMGKPFSYPELRARIEAVLRRTRGERSPTTTKVGVLAINKSTREVTVRGEPVTLTAMEYQLLAHLASNPTNVFTKEELIRNVWGFKANGTTRTVDSHACRIRKVLRDVAGDRFVSNIWGVGYRLVDSVAVV